MPNPKILIASRQTPEVEAMLNDAPRRRSKYTSCHRGNNLAIISLKSKLSMGRSVKQISQKLNHYDGCISHMQALKASCTPLSRQAMCS